MPDTECGRIPGFDARAFGDIYGDSVAMRVAPQGADLAKPAGVPVRPPENPPWIGDYGSCGP